MPSWIVLVLTVVRGAGTRSPSGASSSSPADRTTPTTESSETLRVSPIARLGASQWANDDDVAAGGQSGQRRAEVGPVSRMDAARQFVHGHLPTGGQRSHQLHLERIHRQRHH